MTLRWTDDRPLSPWQRLRARLFFGWRWGR